MPDPPEDLGAVTVDGTVMYELFEHDEDHVELRNVLQPEQSIIIHKEACRGIASVLTKATEHLNDRFGVRRRLS